MPQLGRATLVSLVCIALLVTTDGGAIGLPVHSNLAIDSGTADASLGPFGEFLDASVAGPGFTLTFRACQATPDTTCMRTPGGGPISLPRTVSPNTVFAPTVFSGNPSSSLFFFDFADATISGVRYHFSIATEPSHNAFILKSPIAFDAIFVAPPPGVLGQQIALSAPFTFTTDIVTTDEFLLGAQPLLDLSLSGQGTAMATLRFATCGAECDTWFLDRTTYLFTPSPAPEPAMLVLVATTAGGIAIMSRRRRGRETRHAA